MSKPLFADIRARVETATEGPWAHDTNTSSIREGGDPAIKFRPIIHLEYYCSPLNDLANGGNYHVLNQKNNLDFIAASRTDIPKLLEAIDVMQVAMDNLYEWFKPDVHSGHSAEEIGACCIIQDARDLVRKLSEGES